MKLFSESLMSDLEHQLKLIHLEIENPLVKHTLDSFYLQADDRFSTSRDYKVARILANDLIIIYLEQEIAKLETKTLKNPSPALLFIHGNTKILLRTYSL